MTSNSTSITYVQSMDEVMDFAAWLPEVRTCAFDTETSGIDPFSDTIRMFQISDDSKAWCFPENWIGAAQEYLRDHTPPNRIAHNLDFDRSMLDRAGGWDFFLDDAGFHDTMIMLKVIDPIQQAGLKQAAAFYVSPDAKRGEKELKADMRKGGWGWDTVPLDLPSYWIYGGLDCIYTYHLAKTLWPMIEADERLLGTYELEMQIMPIIWSMRKAGIKVDRKACQALKKSLKADVESRQASFEKAYGFGPGSNLKLADLLVANGVELTEKTKTGKWKMNKDVLDSLDHEIAHQVIEFRELNKLSGTYIDNISSSSDQDGRLHAQTNQCEARTGRMSMRNPNLQNIPSAQGAKIRSLLVAGKGNKLVSCDYSQQELRILAHLSGDPALMAAFDGSVDPFVTIGNLIYDDPLTGKDDPRRNIVKMLSYGLAYGIGVKKFASQMKITVAESGEVRERLYSAFPGLKRFMDDTVNDARLVPQPEGFTVYGRRVTAERDYEYKLTNYIIQGTAADMTKLALLNLWNNGYGEYLRLAVHDEVILELPAHMAADPAVLKEIEVLMSDAAQDRFDIDFPAEAVVGDHYGELK